MADVLDIADRLWRNELDTTQYHPFGHIDDLSPIDDRSGFVASFANVSAFDTDAGLLIVDSGSPVFSGAARASLRAWTDAPVHTTVFTHGHIDHCFGVERYDDDNTARGAPPVTVIAHDAVPDRFDRYRATRGLNTMINRRQFGLGDNFEFPTEYRYPDRTFTDRLDLDIGGDRFELHHARGETDDHTWVWIPARRILCTGDLFIWASPNCGNPQKVQRYPKDWAVALRTMAELDAVTLLPGHGLPIVGADRVRQALQETAALLEFLHDSTVEMMNTGATLDEIVHSVHAPPELLERPYLRPVYDEPEFVVRNTWRLYGGWYDGNPSRLKPAPDATVAQEVAALAGGPAALVARAVAVADGGDLRLAGHLADWAGLAAPDDPDVHRARAEIYERRVVDATSTMAKGVFGWAARESRAVADR
ncbi:MAG TPA: alkyl sulfatase dimerization domain-containing protein [Acidimicrobiia bacterium]|nr:alkyl sulfatase dimerization domain-containing protein [Acidimicrobiia bacterium]